MAKRVCCLYRVSTGKQVDYNGNNEADIPMQRKACHKFALEKGWNIVHEEQEDGVSGHKIRAENRDKIQIIKELARKKQFDILLVFMFDRIGRIADETPFVVEWFVKNGVEVWSTQEGEQRFDNHTDKLLNYIRFWQADGESEKTSVRTKTSLGQIVESGHYKGGGAAYGYDLVKNGRVNKKKHRVHELQINPVEAAVVRLIFNKYTNEGYGAQRISTYLNNNGYRARSGKKWHPASIRGILTNLTYTGVLRCGNSRSEVIEDLQIITPRQYEIAQEIRLARSKEAEEVRHVPLNTRGQSLLAGNVFCAHCGARLNLTTSGKYRLRADGTYDKTPRIRYVCYGKTRKQTECDGPTGYTMHLLDGMIDKLVRSVFEKMRRIPKQELIDKQFAQVQEDRKIRVAAAKGDHAKAESELAVLKKEVVKCIQGQSKFSQDMLADLVDEAQIRCREAHAAYESAVEELKMGQMVLENLSRQYDELVSWADLYDNASIETKKMIVSCLIKRVEVGRDYKLNVEMNLHISQFLFGLNDGGVA